MAASFSCYANEEKDDVSMINDGIEASTRKSQARFQIIRLVLGRASHETK